MNAVLSGRARTVVGFARVLAASHGHSDLESGHLLTAILHEGQNPIVGALHSAGVEIQRLHRDIGSTFHNCETLPGTDFAIPDSPGEKRLLGEAAEQARLRNSPVVWVDHLYFAAVECAAAPLLRVLAEHDLTLERVGAHLQRIRPPH